MPERLRLERLTKTFDGEHAVVDLNLAVRTGELCVILGPSGSGKSTVINMIGGFIPPTSGEIFVDGSPITALAPYARNLGMMFQGYALFPHLTVLENVAFPLRARGVRAREARDKARQMLDVVELGALAERVPHELSGGQQQRTALARALVFGPRLLLMDEPLAALDRRLRERLQGEIRAIQRKLGITMLYITHDQQEAMTLADTIVVMKRGRIEQFGEPLHVYRHPRSRFVCEFLGESNVIEATVESADRDIAVCRVASGHRIAAKGPAPVAVGERVALSLRPECIRFADGAASGDNQLQGRIADIVDLGATCRYRVALQLLQTPMLITEQVGASRPRRKIGDEVRLSFATDDVTLVAT